MDAAAAVHEAAVDAAWIVASALRGRQLLVVHHQARQLWPDPWAAAVLQLQVGVPWLVCDCRNDSRFANRGEHRGGCLDQVAQQVAQLLASADDRARLVLGVGPAWVPLPGQACPTCRRRTVEAEVSSMDEREWIMRCANRCWISTAETHGREHGRLADLLALIRSVRRQGEKRTRRSAASP